MAEALQRLVRAGVTLLNQSVLLRGVNDDAGVLARLNERLFAAGVLPYYLHQLDRVLNPLSFHHPGRLENQQLIILNPQSISNIRSIVIRLGRRILKIHDIGENSWRNASPQAQLLVSK